MSRFIVIGYDDLPDYVGPDSWYLDDDPDYDPCSYLVDTNTNEIVYSDGGEPEDMYLNRNLSVFVDLLNKVSEGS